MHSFQNIEKTAKKLAIVVDVRGYMSTSHVWTGNPEGKGEVSTNHLPVYFQFVILEDMFNALLSCLCFLVIVYC